MLARGKNKPLDRRRRARRAAQGLIVYRQRHYRAGSCGRIRDLSEGGVFVRTIRRPQVASIIAGTLRLRGNPEVDFLGRVCWVTARQDPDGDWRDGFGVEFVWIQPGGRSALRAALSAQAT